MRIVVGISGGIAAYKTPDLVRRLQRDGFEVGAAMTPSARQFVTPLVLKTLCDGIVMDDIFEVESEGVGHIDLADWAELVAIVPATAQTLSRLATGQADEPVSLTALATQAPRVVFPAMNVNMWQAAATQRNVATLRQDGFTVVDPAEGELACGWLGAGRLPDLDLIVRICRAVATPKDLRGRRMVVTAGPTREAIDPVRFLSNPSSGKMGYALAARGAARGADVTLVSGPTALPAPWGVELVPVTTAAELYEATDAAAGRAPLDVLIAAAAVADYTPTHPRARKHKKGADDDELRQIELSRTTDVLATVVADHHPRVAVGFAAETDAVVDHAREKLQKKQLDMVVANDVGAREGGFNDDRNRVWLVQAGGAPRELPLAAKTEIADRILDEVRALLERSETPAGV